MRIEIGALVACRRRRTHRKEARHSPLRSYGPRRRGLRRMPATRRARGRSRAGQGACQPIAGPTTALAWKRTTTASTIPHTSPGTRRGIPRPVWLRLSSRTSRGLGASNALTARITRRLCRRPRRAGVGVYLPRVPGQTITQEPKITHLSQRLRKQTPVVALAQCCQNSCSNWWRTRTPGCC